MRNSYPHWGWLFCHDGTAAEYCYPVVVPEKNHRTFAIHDFFRPQLLTLSKHKIQYFVAKNSHPGWDGCIEMRWLPAAAYFALLLRCPVCALAMVRLRCTPTAATRSAPLAPPLAAVASLPKFSLATSSLPTILEAVLPCASYRKLLDKTLVYQRLFGFAYCSLL